MPKHRNDEPDDPRAREALGLPPLYHDDTPSLDTSFHDHEMAVDDDDRCSNPGGHEFECTGTAYGGDDESYYGEGRCYCIHCGADGDG